MIKAYISRIKRNPYKFFFFKLIAFLIMMVILDLAVGSFLSYFFYRQKSGAQFVTTYSIEKTTADILIFGSSRATHHYHPNIFEEKMKLSCYNVGRDGNSMLYHYAILNAVLKRYYPKIVILDLKNNEFKFDQENYDRLSCLLPYYRTHPEIRSVVDLKSNNEKQKLFSHTYPFNSTLFYTAMGNLNIHNTRAAEIKGYVPLKKIWTEPLKTSVTPDNSQLDTTMIKAYELFIQLCLQAKVKLYVVCSPYYNKHMYVDNSLKVGEEIAAKYNVPFLNFYSGDTEYIRHPEYFADVPHLNEKGAALFSNQIIDTLLGRGNFARNLSRNN